MIVFLHLVFCGGFFWPCQNTHDFKMAASAYPVQRVGAAGLLTGWTTGDSDPMPSQACRLGPLFLG